MEKGLMFGELFWEMRQQLQIAEADGNARRARTKSDHVSSDLRRLTQQVDRITLASQAMWELLRDRTELTEADLAEKMLEIDLRDGIQDGRLAPGKVNCPQCHRLTRTNRPTCLYCGTEIDRDHVFQ